MRDFDSRYDLIKVLKYKKMCRYFWILEMVSLVLGFFFKNVIIAVMCITGLIGILAMYTKYRRCPYCYGYIGTTYLDRYEIKSMGRCPMCKIVIPDVIRKVIEG